MSDSAVDVAEDRSRLDQCPTGAERFPDPIGTLGEPDRTVDNLKEMLPNGTSKAEARNQLSVLSLEKLHQQDVQWVKQEQS